MTPSNMPQEFVPFYLNMTSQVLVDEGKLNAALMMTIRSDGPAVGFAVHRDFSRKRLVAELRALALTSEQLVDELRSRDAKGEARLGAQFAQILGGTASLVLQISRNGRHNLQIGEGQEVFDAPQLSSLLTLAADGIEKHFSEGRVDLQGAGRI